MSNVVWRAVLHRDEHLLTDVQIVSIVNEGSDKDSRPLNYFFEYMDIERSLVRDSLSVDEDPFTSGKWQPLDSNKLRNMSDSQFEELIEDLSDGIERPDEYPPIDWSNVIDKFKLERNYSGSSKA